MDKENLSIVIPAAGLGHRLMSKKPKALISFNGISILERQLDILHKTFPKAEINLVVGFGAESIIKKTPTKVKIIKNTEFKRGNVAQSLKIGISQSSNNNVLIVYGDLVFQEDLFNRFNSSGSFLLYENNNNLKNEEVGVNIVDNKVWSLNYTFNKKWCQIAYLDINAKSSFLNNCSKENDRLFGFEIINKTIDEGIYYSAIMPSGLIISEIDSFKDITRTKRLFNEDII